MFHIRMLIRAAIAIGSATVLCLAQSVCADATPTTDQSPGATATSGGYAPDTEQNEQQTPLNAWAQKTLPTSLSDQLDVNLWGWFAYQHNSLEEYNNNWNGDVALDINKGFGDRFALDADMHFKQYNKESYGDLEQAWAKIQLVPDSTVLTVGKFNANIGLEHRDFWDRYGGTTSLLFGAEPQDLTGIMIKQPIGQSGVSVSPFLAANFQRQVDFRTAPSFGAIIQYQPTDQLTLRLTGWSGPGFLESDENGYEDDETTEYSSQILQNWDGPHFDGERGGQLLFVDGNMTWQPRNDLTVGAEYLFGTTGSSEERTSWAGLMVLCNYDLDDRTRLFGRWSYLNDFNGLVTGIEQRRHEVSVGVARNLTSQVELRAEYRHDFSNEASDVDSVSIHLSFHM